MPRMHELSWRVDFEEFSFKRIGLTARHAGGSPPSTDVDFARPFLRIEHAGIDPPIYDLLRGQSPESPLWRAAMSTEAMTRPATHSATAPARILISLILPLAYVSGSSN